MLLALDWFFLIFHSVLVIFNITGWALARTRKLNLITLLLTGISWTAVGMFYGRIGYCVCTDWHWSIRRQLGYHDRSSTYIQFLVERTVGIVPDLFWTQVVSATAFLIALTMSIVLNIRDARRA
ncbi:MAG TPA: DUF2784 family protein, partial [Fimbriimonas sp.]|nr:DUF2784 family protein [Fimbriimonas sp.]